MGLLGLYPYLAKKAPSCKDTAVIAEYSGKRIGIDGKASLYHVLPFTGPDPDALAEGMAELGKWLKKNGVEPVIIMDGKKTPKEKQKTLEKRQTIKRKALAGLEAVDSQIRAKKAKIEGREFPTGQALAISTAPETPQPLASAGDIVAEDKSKSSSSVSSNEKVEPKETETAKSLTDDPLLPLGAAASPGEPRVDYVAMLELEQLRALEEDRERKVKRTWNISTAVCEHVVAVLRERGFLCFVSSSEADFLLARLSKTGLVAAVAADDGDMFAFGVEVVLRNIHRHMYGSVPLDRYTRSKMLRELKLDDAQFVEWSLLLHCDYLEPIPKIGIVRAHAAICAHGTVDKFLDSLTDKQRKVHVEPEGYRERLAAARACFVEAQIDNDMDEIRAEIEKHIAIVA